MKKILIANRGEIAVRIIKTCREMGIATVAVASEADLGAKHARLADEVIPIGAAPAVESYLRGDVIIEAAKQSGAEGIHPGFGFLSENAGFAAAVREAGLMFIGPQADVIQLMGSKQESKRVMKKAGVPVVPGYNGDNQEPDHLAAEAEKIGFPLLIKASAGGGGKGMRVVNEAKNFNDALGAAKREAKAAFGDDTVLLEKYLTRPRHIEYQVFGDEHGQLVHLFERECSIQRRHQKIVEETPSTAMGEALRARMAEAALTAARAVNYTNAGTVEFMLDEDESFYFLEMNTRLQVEHPVTECLTGQDLVRWQIEVARGNKMPLTQEQLTRRGHAVEVRIYAEDPAHDFLPQTGTIVNYAEPIGLNVRVDSGVETGDAISIYYDPMIAKLIAWGETRDIACDKLVNALAEYCIQGVHTNVAFLRKILQEAEFRAGNTTTAYLSHYAPDLAVPTATVDTALALTCLAEPETQAAGGAGPTFQEPWQQLSGWRADQ
ncbi:acetyl-CoA carboxylase biotin carboxylase subunit [Acanthopleuribacter pedis]|uniref:Acetyl-CoA carboxylase biotin carboxylase subunit n=1 Tax=Acanthopleuribacter pedis TaxID=442870 RepID=A0A8J7Q7S5_9BACT|nr:acetyl-CoA carboxylase biotin carboxylase subunit [Acanthopleuribacter pedis]MBO1318424.1 acetyl-CoA carboxylase biotin carboxylase subunit [Acanthopleuribacter pedis]